MTQNNESGVETLSKGIDYFAEAFIGDKHHHCKLPDAPKIIHDPLWGTIKLDKWEVALLDLPLFQRLRQIHQTSLVSYVFPGCTHTRFEHTLGVIQQTQHLIDAVNKQYTPGNQQFENSTVRNLRLAALFHDCGHSCFSHISEDLYESCFDLEAQFKQEGFPRCNPHEALSYLILKSKPVKDYIKKIEDHYAISFDIEKAANWIIGIPSSEENGRRQYEAQIINGPFDADKLDYIFRDAHYSGIPVGLDLDRLWATCMVSDQSSKKILTLSQSSVAPLEQILFSKMNLFAIVYQHPKVRAAEKMFQAILEMAKDKQAGIQFNVSDRVLDLSKATDYLWLTDEVFFAEALKRSQSDKLHKMIHDIRYRRLLVRALTISGDTVNKEGSEGEFLQLLKLNQSGGRTYTAKRQLASMIIDAAGLKDKLEAADVWLDIPAVPKFGEADRTFVRTASKELRKVSKLFPIEYWTDMYRQYKWRGHVFCPHEYQQIIHEASLEVFKNEFDLKIKRSAGEISHVPHPKATD